MSVFLIIYHFPTEYQFNYGVRPFPLNACVFVGMNIEIFVAFEIIAASLICVALCKKKNHLYYKTLHLNFVLDLKWLEVNHLHKLLSTMLFIFSSFFKKKYLSNFSYIIHSNLLHSSTITVHGIT